MIKDQILQLIDDSASFLGYMVYSSSIYLKGENTRISVKIDSLSGISHGDCEKYSRELSDRLEEENILLNFSLEVSSPGLKRELRNIKEFERFKNSPVKIIYETGAEQKVFIGTIESISGELVKVISENDRIEIPISDILKAKLDF